MAEIDALICAYRLDGKGGAQKLDWPEIEPPSRPAGLRWVHLQRESDAARGWLIAHPDVPAIVRDAFLAAESRPRVSLFDHGLYIDLRGVNLNPGSNAEDMVSIRVWFTENEIVSVRRRKLMAIDAIRSDLDGGKGVTTKAGYLIALADGLVARMGTVIADLDERIDDMEDEILTAQSRALRRRLSEARREAIALRRYIGPNREAIARLMVEDISWLSPVEKQRLREISDRITRYIEDLDTVRERAAVLQDELTNRLSEAMNRNTYMLTVVAGVFLPLSLLTGLLGINVAGIPGDKWDYSFIAVCILLIVLGAFEIWYLRRRNWF